MSTSGITTRIFLSAGEASGDHYGAQLITALRRSLPDAEFFGLGGREMESAGFHRVIKAEDVAVMGITEVLLHLPRIYGSYRKLVASIRTNPPQVAVLIDFPDVNLRLARELKKLNVPVVYLVSPQLWAWKRKRLRWVQERVTRMLVIFPFEERFYRARGVTAEFIGHPLADNPLPTISRDELARQTTFVAPGGTRHALDPNKPWIALLPGSRVGEMLHNLPELVKAAYALGDQYEFIVPVAPTLTVAQIGKLEFNLGTWTPTDGPPPRISFVKDAAAALLHADASVVASGTATVLAALMGKPFIVVYKVSALSYAIARRAIRYPAEIAAPLDEEGHPPVAMVNLIAGRRVVPELLQHRFTPENMHAALKPLLHDTPERAAMVAALAEIRTMLRPTDVPAIERAAASVLATLQG
jgi:lipid-A-disaccharide synthase